MLIYKKLSRVNKVVLWEFFKKSDSLFPIPLSHKQNLESLSDKLLNSGIVIAAYYDDAIAGVVCGYANDTENGQAYISVLCVLPEFQGKSIAIQLVEEFIKESKAANMGKIFLYTHNTNEKAIKLYQKIGFTPVESDRDGDIKMYYKL